ncbi:MAG: amidohydrolase [Planctomycetota bacterium]
MADADLVLAGRPWVAIRDGRIAAIGHRHDLLGIIGSRTEVIDLGDARVHPGLKDWHAHLVPTGLFRRRIDLSGMTAEEAARAVAGRVLATPPGTWVRGMGFTLDALGVPAPLPVEILDAVAPEHPVWLSSHDLHAIWLNTRALRCAGRPAGSPAYLTEDEIRVFSQCIGRESLNERTAAVRDAQREFHSYGITAVQDHGRLEDLEAMAALGVANEIRLRIDFSVRFHEYDDWREIRPAEPPFPGLLRVNGLKVFLDGALGSRTAWTLASYDDHDGTGHRALDHEEALEKVKLAARDGVPTFFHAIGDAAVREALDLAAAAPGLPHRVEHAQLIHPDDRARFVEQGVMASVQPVHLLTDTPTLLDAWGEARARASFPVKTLLDLGAEVRFGSDTPVEHENPMLGVFAATTRCTLAGDLLPGTETIPVARALSLYYSFPKLVPGLPADLVVYPEEPERLPVTDLPDLRPSLVVFGGEIVHRG